MVIEFVIIPAKQFQFAQIFILSKSQIRVLTPSFILLYIWNQIF